MSADDKMRRKVWTIEETRGFLKCYLAHKDEFLHLGKKRKAYAHVLEDMIAQGFTDSSTTTVALEGKMRSLLITYKSAKENSRKSTARCPAPFMAEMDRIFGSNEQCASVANEQCASVANAHTLHLGRGPTQALAVLPLPPSSPNMSPLPSPHSSASSRQATTLKPPRRSSHRSKTAREIYYEGKLKIKKKLAKEKMAEKKRLSHSIVEILKNSEAKKLEILKSSLKSVTS